VLRFLLFSELRLCVFSLVLPSPGFPGRCGLFLFFPALFFRAALRTCRRSHPATRLQLPFFLLYVLTPDSEVPGLGLNKPDSPSFSCLSFTFTFPSGRDKKGIDWADTVTSSPSGNLSFPPPVNGDPRSAGRLPALDEVRYFRALCMFRLPLCISLFFSWSLELSWRLFGFSKLEPNLVPLVLSRLSFFHFSLFSYYFLRLPGWNGS